MFDFELSISFSIKWNDINNIDLFRNRSQLYFPITQIKFVIYSNIVFQFRGIFKISILLNFKLASHPANAIIEKRMIIMSFARFKDFISFLMIFDIEWSFYLHESNPAFRLCIHILDSLSCY